MGGRFGAAARGPAFARGEPPPGKSGPDAARYYYRPLALAPGEAEEAHDPAFERCAARCLAADKCWFIATSGENFCTLHTGLFAMTSFSV